MDERMLGDSSLMFFEWSRRERTRQSSFLRLALACERRLWRLSPYSVVYRVYVDPRARIIQAIIACTVHVHDMDGVSILLLASSNLQIFRNSKFPLSFVPCLRPYSTA